MVNINNSFGAWGSHIPKNSLDTTIDYVLTGANVATANQDPLIKKYIGYHHHITVLDFGCGIGRNAIPLALENTGWIISVYDNPEMVKQMHKFCVEKYKINLTDISNIKIYTDWNEVKSQSFDYIYSTLVFQHINEQTINFYIEDIKVMTHNLIISGRRYNDDGNKNTWQILENNGLYPINKEQYKTNGDPNNHQTAIYKI